MNMSLSKHHVAPLDFVDEIEKQVKRSFDLDKDKPNNASITNTTDSLDNSDVNSLAMQAASEFKQKNIDPSEPMLDTNGEEMSYLEKKFRAQR